MNKFPSFSQWKQIFKVLKKSEKTILLAFFLLAVISSGFLVVSFHLKNTKIIPTLGGNYREAVIGNPRFVNPIYGETNDVDRALIDLVFSGLMTYDGQGQIVNDLADNYKISGDGTIYNFHLKDNVFWHDGKPLISDDVIFTVKTIQNSDYKSPLRANWIDVEVEKISDRSLRFILKRPYNAFLENCALKIMPKHIWQNISPENFILSSYNLQPIGSGPFELTDIKQTETGFIKTLNLQSNRKYYNNPPFIANISFRFFEKKEDLIKAAKAKEIDGFALASLENNEVAAEKEVYQDRLGYLPARADKNFSVYYFSLPRYFAVFFNYVSGGQKSPIFSDQNVRKALTHAVNKDELIRKINSGTKNNISRVDSPVLPDFFGYQQPSDSYNFDVEKAKSLLDKSGFLAKGESASGGKVPKPAEGEPGSRPQGNLENNGSAPLAAGGSGQREKTIDKKPAFQFKNYLKVGSKGKEVTQLQECLSRLDDNFKTLLKDEVSGTYSKATENIITEFQKKYLTDVEPTGEVGKLTRQKLNELCITPPQNSQPLKFTLVTIDQPQLLEVANLLKNYWQNVGASVDIKAVSITDLKPIIKNRNYDALLYGEALGAEPDLYPFWHSSQKIDPGLNLSSYENKDVDKLLKDARETLDKSIKKQKYEKLQDLVINDAPALFLYNPDYIYWVSSKTKGVDTQKIIDPAKRFVNITNWYIKTKRVWK